MIKKINIFSSLFLLAWSVAAMANMISLVAKPQAPVVNVRLAANPSTGYQWTLAKYDANLLETPSSEYFPSHAGLPGAPGYIEWRFSVKPAAFAVPQKTKVILEYKRPWEKSAVQQQVIEINIFNQR